MPTDVLDHHKTNIFWGVGLWWKKIKNINNGDDIILVVVAVKEVETNGAPKGIGALLKDEFFP